MARGVEECPKTLVVLTPDYIASEWCDLELVMGQAFLGRIACFRSPVGYETLKALAEEEEETHTKARRHEGGKSDEISSSLCLSAFVRDLDADHRDLVARGLLHHDTGARRFDLHPIVRRYAYDRLAAPDRTAALLAQLASH
jgi:hypothetical protein